MKRYKLWRVVLLILLVFFLLPAYVFAVESNVTYQGGAEGFVFVPASGDLFDNFKGVMPGDTIEQKIVLENARTDRVVRIYLKGKELGDHERLLLSEASLSGRIGSTEIFNYDAPETDLSTMVLLKALDPGERVDLFVTLAVPLTLGNDFQSQDYTIVWTFLAEEIVIEQTTVTSPTTPEETTAPTVTTEETIEETVAGEEETKTTPTEEDKPVPTPGESMIYTVLAVLCVAFGVSVYLIRKRFVR